MTASNSLSVSLMTPEISTYVEQELCPDLSRYWQLGKLPNADKVLLKSLDGKHQHTFSLDEGLVLQYFSGRFTVAQVQQFYRNQMGKELSTEFVLRLIQTLLRLGILEMTSEYLLNARKSSKTQWQLKPGVTWIQHQDGYWILRNAEDFTFMQLPPIAKVVVEALGNQPPDAVAQEYDLTAVEVRSLLQQMMATGMFVGTQPPQPPKGKFKPTQLLFFKLTVCNPDRWLTQTLPLIRWMWSRLFALVLMGFLAACTVVGLAQHQSILHTGMQLWQAMGPGVFIPFGLLAMTVVTIHELGHAYTLKHYGGIVPEVGFMFMCLMPAAYTNTTDQYALTQRSQRILVVAAGVFCQFAIAAIALCLWNLSVPGSWLAATSYLLLVAALFTVALNLNPLARFDGYYLLTALTGINNLKSRSFGFYRCLLMRQPCLEPQKDRWILAVYAPLSLIYLLLVFGQLFLFLSQWILLNMPFLTLGLLTLWAIYYFFPGADDAPKSA